MGGRRDFWAQVKEQLAAEGVVVTPEDEAALGEFARLVQEWNPFASLVSEGDMGHLWERHIADAMGLVGWIKRFWHPDRMWLDIGSGGGFPAVPIKILAPEARVVLVDRSERKAGFLRKAIGALGLERIDVVHGAFPEAVRAVTPGIVTARAVERPTRLLPQILRFLPGDAVFLCQFPEHHAIKQDGFHVERVEDAWGSLGFRRGPLRVVRRAKG